MIRPIQLIIFFLLLALMGFYLTRLRSKLADRLIVIIVGSFGLLMVMMPELSNRIAHVVGVGRGVDLVMYLSIIGLMFLWIGTYTRIRDLETQQTRLVRSLALAQARLPAQDVLAAQELPDSPDTRSAQPSRPCESSDDTITVQNNMIE
jgi:hypothetical protein